MSSKSVLYALCFALAVSSLARAGSQDRTILVLLKNVPGAPTPQQVVDYVNSGLIQQTRRCKRSTPTIP